MKTSPPFTAVAALCLLCLAACQGTQTPALAQVTSPSSTTASPTPPPPTATDTPYPTDTPSPRPPTNTLSVTLTQPWPATSTSTSTITATPSATQTRTVTPTHTGTPPTSTPTGTPTPVGAATPTPTLPPGAWVWISPAETVIEQAGQRADVNVLLSQISGVFEIALEISFDPALLQVVDAFPLQGGVQVLPGNCPLPDLVIFNLVDNDAGEIVYEASQLVPSPPCNGGTVITIKFECLASGSSEVLFEFTEILAQNFSDIEHDFQDGAIRCEL